MGGLGHYALGFFENMGSSSSFSGRRSPVFLTPGVCICAISDAVCQEEVNPRHLLRMHAFIEHGCGPELGKAHPCTSRTPERGPRTKKIVLGHGPRQPVHYLRHHAQVPKKMRVRDSRQAVPQELSAALSEVLRDCNVHETMRLALQQQELLTVEDFPTLSHLDSLFSNLDAEAKETLAITDAASSVHCARLRRALDRCHAKSALEGRATQPSAALPTQASQAFSVAALQPDSWAEHLPPKLTPEAVEVMRDTFVLNYPGVLLDQDTMPSIRLLSIVHHSLKPGQRDPLDSLAAAPQPKAVSGSHGGQSHQAEAQLLSAALFDDTPEMTLQQGAVTAAWLTRVQKPFRNAWALCGAAHLHNLKAFNKKVAELCRQHFDQDLGLRSPNMQNSWQQIARWNLIWSLDDAL